MYDQPNPERPNPKPPPTAIVFGAAPGDWRRRIGIKAGLRLAFAVMAGVAVATAALAYLAMSRAGDTIDRIVGDRLPLALETMHLGRQTDALVALAGPLVAGLSDEARNQQRARIDFGVAELNRSLARLKGLGARDAAARILPIANQLASNLLLLDALTRERAALMERKSAARRHLLLNLQAFQSQLAYRFRMLEGDIGVLSRQMKAGEGDSPLWRRRFAAAADLVPSAKLYADVEAINGRLLAAGEEPTPADVDVAVAAVRLKMADASNAFMRLDPTTAVAVNDTLAMLGRLAFDPDGLPALRTRELTIIADSRRLLEENALIAQNVNRAVTALVDESRGGVNAAATEAAETRAASLTALLTAVATMLAGVAVLMRYYVGGYLIRRLSWLTDGMLAISGGRYGAPLPPEGPDELGRLAQALRKFRDMAISSERRETELRAANIKANDALAALEAAQQDLMRQARTDFLTGAANRQHFMETAERLWLRGRRDGAPISILMIDIDHFKRINDTYGHLTGDDVLRAFAAVCCDALRPSDLFGRLGGEEFAAVLPRADLPGALEAAERLRAAVAGVETQVGGVKVRVTVSIGVAQSTGDDHFDDAIARADAALYVAKQSGRNRVAA